MKRALVSAVAFVAWSVPAQSAAPAAPAPPPAGELPWSLTAEMALASKYVWRGAAISNGAVFQDTFTVAWEGLSFELFGNVDLYDASASQGGYNEFDYNLDWTWSFENGMSASVGGYHYTFPWAEAVPPTTEFYAGVGCAAEDDASGFGLEASLKVYRDVDDILGYYGELKVDCAWAMGEKNELGVGLLLGVGDDETNLANLGVKQGGMADAVLTLSLARDVGAMSVSVKASCSCIADADIRDRMTKEPDHFFVTAAAEITF